MNKLVALCVLLGAPLAIKAEQTTEIVMDFCVSILHQTSKEATTCYNAPEDYSTQNGNDAILIYLCCLGCFGGVTNDYTPFLQEDFLKYVSQMTTDKLILCVAKFVIACKGETRQLSKAHFLSWLDNGQTDNACPPV